jgi:hypothetical protein
MSEAGVMRAGPVEESEPQPEWVEPGIRQSVFGDYLNSYLLGNDYRMMSGKFGICDRIQWNPSGRVEILNEIP